MGKTKAGKTEGGSGHVIYLVDGSGFIFRAYFGLPPLTRSRDKLPVGAVSGFCNMLSRLIETSQSDGAASHLAVIFDSARATFRNEIYAEYKANRDAPPEDLKPQFPLVRDAVRAFGMPPIEKPGFEADDLIATYTRLARARGDKVVIVSSDKDLMQLVGEGVEMLDPLKDIRIGPDQVREKFGVGPERVVDVQSLAGDSSDNVPGVPGIGIKTAAELINTYGDLDTLLARAGEIKQPKRRETLLNNADKARMSRELVRLRDDVPIEVDLDAFRIKPIEAGPLVAFLDDMEFKSLKSRLLARHLLDGDIDRAYPPPAGSIEAAELSGAAPASKAEDAPNVVTQSYELVQDLGRLADWIVRATEAGLVAVDTETTSLDAACAELVGVSLAVAPGQACYIPLGHVSPGAAPGGGFDFTGAPAPKQIPLKDALKALAPMLADPAVLKVGQNIKYDMVVLASHGITITPIDDTMLISYALDGTRHGHGMDELSALHLGHKTISYEDVTGSGKTQIGFAQVPLEQARDYAAEDADITLRLHAFLKQRLVTERMSGLYERIERGMPVAIAGMEAAGIKVDRAYLAELSADFATRMAELEKEAHKLAGEDFNIGSPKQLGEILFDKMSLPGGKKGKTGAYSTSADVLEELAAGGHDLPRKVLDWRQLQKLKSTYTDALQAAINPRTQRVHTSFSLSATSTGRLSSSEPNLQNIPIRTEEGRKIRRAFIAEKGARLISADYSQIELRILAHIADIVTLKDAFRDRIDIHALTASQVFNVPIEGMDPMVRRSAKAINFGIIYGMSAFGLAAQLGIPQREAQKYIEAYFARYPGIRAYMDTTKKAAHDQGYVETLFGRRCWVPGINSRSPAERNFNERAAINAPIQGTAADIIKRAMVKLPGALAAAGLQTRMLLQVHDELVFEAPEAEAEDARKLIIKVMEGAASLSVPLTVEAGIGLNWGEAH